MKRIVAHCVVTAVAVILSSSSALGQASSDTVYSDKGVIRGTIKAMSPTEVKVSVAGAERRISVNEIKRIIFADDPPELARARQSVLEGQNEQALQTLAQVKLTANERSVIRQDVEFYTALAAARLALAGGGDAAKAKQLMMNFARGNTGSYHFYEAAETLGHLALAQGSFSEAAKYYGALAKTPWPGVQLKGIVLEANALRAGGDFPNAGQKYQQVMGASASTPAAMRQKTIATIGRAACVAETGDPDQGIKVLEEIIKKNDPQDQELFARAYNAMGDCYRKSNKSKDAVLAYLHVDILFVRDADAHAEALYRLSNLWSDVDKPDRAVQARNLLKSRYAGSAWAKK